MGINLREKAIYRITLIGSLVNILLTVLKFVAGVVGHSSAMIADAVHSLSDLVTDIIVILFVKTASKPSDRTHEYGHGKFETLATFLVGLILMGVGVGILYHGILECIACIEGKPQEAPGWIALAVAVISIVAKEALYHSTLNVGREWNSEVVIANAWHHRSDSISSIATLIGIAGSMFLGVEWRILDPLAASLVSFFIIKVGYDTIQPSVDELLERSLPIETEKRIGEIIRSVEGVNDFDKLHTRKIGRRLAIEVDVKLNGKMTLEDASHVTDKIKDALRREFGGDTHVGIGLEPCSSQNNAKTS